MAIEIDFIVKIWKSTEQGLLSHYCTTWLCSCWNTITITKIATKSLDVRNGNTSPDLHRSMDNSTTLAQNTTAALISQCLPAQDKIPLLGTTTRHILAAIHIGIMSFGTPANAVVAYLIYKTRQYENQSTRLIMYLSTVDIFGELIINGVYVLYMFLYERFNCVFILTMHMLVNSVISIFFLLLVGIAFDRMMKIRYLNEYGSKLTPFRFRLVVACLMLLAGVQSMLHFVGIFFFDYGYARILSAPIYVICSASLVACHLFSIKKLKEMNMVSQRVSSSDRSIVRIASLHLAIFVACVFPVIVWQFISNIFLSEIFSEVLLIFLMHASVSLHSTLNAFMFLYVNRDARRRVIAFVERVGTRFRSIPNRFNNKIIPVENIQQQ